jgi:N-acetylglucosaminyldiphosphoundecaprenol N-acetyl-beta-D-mannosaminyltransferase
MSADNEVHKPTESDSAGTVELLGCPLHLYSMSETLSVISERLNHGLFTQHGVVNVAKLVNMRRDPDLWEAVKACNIINADGMGIVWGGRFLGLSVPERVTGIDLFFELMKLAVRRREKVFLLGAKPHVVQKTVAELALKYPGLLISGWHHGYFENEQEVVEEIRASGATMLFVAMSSPRKELFINSWRIDLGVKFAMGVGGTFDVIAGETRRAPLLWQRTGLEWLFRVMQEPGRMWKRYLTTNFVFLALLVNEKIKTKCIKMGHKLFK